MSCQYWLILVRFSKSNEFDVGLFQLLDEMSPIAHHARLLGDELSDICMFHDTSINDLRLDWLLIYKK